MYFRIEYPSIQGIVMDGKYHRDAVVKAANKLGLTGSERKSFIRGARVFKIDSMRVGSGRPKSRW